MKLLTASMKMADVVHSNYLLMPVIRRFGIPLGFGEETVADVCTKHGIDTEFFLAIVNAFSNEQYFPQKKLQAVNVLTILDYLEKTHSYYFSTEVPLIEKLLGRLLKSRSADKKYLTLIRKFFLEYKKELFAHLRREDDTTFPYIKNVYRLFNRGDGSRREKEALSRYSMLMYEEEHSDIDEKLYDLKNILIKYFHGEESDELCSQIIFELFRLEKDIQDHTRIENNVLRPLVMEMEAALFDRYDRKTRQRVDGEHGPVRLHHRDPHGMTASGLMEHPAAAMREDLSPREIEILRLVASGFLNKEIADKCAISLHTVISHRKNITRKLQIKTVAGLTVYALLNDIISSEDIN